MKKLLAIGALPPPVHGMSKNFKIAVDDFTEFANVDVINTSPGKLEKDFYYHFSKFKNISFSLFPTIYNLFRRKYGACYICPDGGLGFLYSYLLIRLVLSFKIKVFIHHRSFAYLKKRNNLMTKLCSIKNAEIKHIFLCFTMKEIFLKSYAVHHESVVISNAKYINKFYNQIESRNDIYSSESKLVVGHLSNLSESKGVFEFLNIARFFFEQASSIQFLLAGPFESSEVKNQVTEQLSYLGNVKYLGPIYGEEKESFFKNIDIFVFPSEYINEAQPNVLFEAQSFASVVIALKNACIVSDITCDVGFVIDERSEFVVDAAEIITRLHENRSFLYEFQHQSLIKITKESISSKGNYQLLINDIKEALLG